MEVVGKIFDDVLILKRSSAIDVAVNEDEIEGFIPKETRTYEMPVKGTFFGIHYRELSDPLTKLVTVIKGCGMDYVIDLRKDSPTYLKWEKIELNEDNKIAVLIPAGFGHAFLSLTDDTIQSFTIDASGKNGSSKVLNYKEEKIGLELEIPVTVISDKDINAPYL